MRRLLIKLTAVFAAAVICRGQSLLINPFMLSPGYLYRESFNPTGYDNSWTENNNPDEDYTTSPMEGAQMLSVGTTSSSFTYTVFNNRDNVYVYLRWKYTSYTSTARFWSILIEDSSGNDLAAVSVKDSDGSAPYVPVLRAECTGGTAGGDITLAPDTVYHIWLEYEKGTGANAACRVYTSTDGTKGTVDSQVTNGTVTAQAYQLKLAAAANEYYYADAVLINGTAIGDSPW